MQHCKALYNYVVIRHSCSPLTAHSSRLCYAQCKPHPLLSFLHFILFYFISLSFCALVPSPRPTASAGRLLQGRRGSYLNDLSWLSWLHAEKSFSCKYTLVSPALCPRPPAGICPSGIPKPLIKVTMFPIGVWLHI